MPCLRKVYRGFISDHGRRFENSEIIMFDVRGRLRRPFYPRHGEPETRRGMFLFDFHDTLRDDDESRKTWPSHNKII